MVYNGKKPRELTDLLGIDSLQISENVRAIKDKIKTALKHLDEKYPIDNLDSVDWGQLKKDAEMAQQEIAALADWFQQKNI